MEHEIKKYHVAKKLKMIMAKGTRFSPSLTDVEIEQYLEEVMIEVKKAKIHSGK